MNIRELLKIQSGGMGSRCNPEQGPCGRRVKSIRTKKYDPEKLLKAAEELYGDRASFRILLSREIRDAYPGKALHGWNGLTKGQKKIIAERCHAKAQDRYRTRKK